MSISFHVASCVWGNLLVGGIKERLQTLFLADSWLAECLRIFVLKARIRIRVVYTFGRESQLGGCFSG